MCQFGQISIGHRIKDWAFPLPSKVAAVADFQRPLTVRALKEFLGVENFYHRFVPLAARLMWPLFKALKGRPLTHN